MSYPNDQRTTASVRVTTDQATIAELTLALSAAELRAKTAEQRAKETEAALDHAIELMNDQTTGSYFVMQENEQLKAEITSMRAVVDAAREAAMCCAGTAQHPCRDGMCLPRLRAALAAIPAGSEVKP